DFANPRTAPLITLYPEDVGDHPVSEMWQVPGGRWMEIPQDLLPPSVLVWHKHYYIHEIAELADSTNSWVIPQFWITTSKTLHAECYAVHKHIIDGQFTVPVTELVQVTHKLTPKQVKKFTSQSVEQ
ncbi:hypothetical protein MPER_09145, partial [Moniliophthora perniciosa FA553]